MINSNENDSDDYTSKFQNIIKLIQKTGKKKKKCIFFIYSFFFFLENLIYFYLLYIFHV